MDALTVERYGRVPERERAAPPVPLHGRETWEDYRARYARAHARLAAATAAGPDDSWWEEPRG